MLYCSELQLISFLPELASLPAGGPLPAAILVSLDRSRKRRDELDLMADKHRISAAGDDCQSMRRLINEGRTALHGGAWGSLGDDDLRTIHGAIHRLQILNYGVARSLAVKARLRREADEFDDMLNDLLQRFPETCDLPVLAGPFHIPGLATR